MLKKQYTDLLDSADLEKIFDNDTSLGSVLKEAKNSAIAVTIVWLIMVAIIGITISVLRVPDAAKQGTESVHQTPTATVDQNNITQ